MSAQKPILTHDLAATYAAGKNFLSNVNKIVTIILATISLESYLAGDSRQHRRSLLVIRDELAYEIYLTRHNFYWLRPHF